MLQIGCTRLASFEASVISTLDRYCTNCQILKHGNLKFQIAQFSIKTCLKKLGMKLL